MVVHEWLRWKRGRWGTHGGGHAASGEAPDARDQRIETPLQSPDLLAVNALGQFQEHPRVAALRDFIMGWHVSYLSAEGARGQPEAGPHERLTRTGDNLANVIQYLSERHPERLERIFDTLRGRVPRIERVLAHTMQDGRLLLQIKDAPFDHPVLARFASDGTLKMLAYLVLLYDPEPPPFIGIEEPENFLHPRLLHDVGEECRAACARTQLLVTTHSPFFLDALRPQEVRVLWRNRHGHTRTRRIDELRGVSEFVEAGAKLGDLWMEADGGPVPGRRPVEEPGHARSPVRRRRRMTVRHVEVLTEELSMEAFLEVLLPRLLPADTTFYIHSFQGKPDLLKNLGSRLRAYARWLPREYRIVVVVDRDSGDCRKLKEALESTSTRSGLLTPSRVTGGRRQVVNRVAVEELEAWYFGDWEAVCVAYPRTSRNIPRKAPYRDPDAIRGGTWETFERIMQRHGYFEGGLRKVEAARTIAEFIDPARNRSGSFGTFRDAIVEATAMNEASARGSTA